MLKTATTHQWRNYIGSNFQGELGVQPQMGTYFFTILNGGGAPGAPRGPPGGPHSYATATDKQFTEIGHVINM